MLEIDTTWLSWVLAFLGCYYVFLFVDLHIRRRRGAAQLDRSYEPLICVVIPSHNEEKVIGHTIEALLHQDYGERLIVVMNDGSSDRTGEIARRYAGPDVIVVDRGADIAGRGKGDVLNHAFEMLCELADRGDPLVRGRSPEDIVICVVDADGQLGHTTLGAVAPYFADPAVGGLQIGVRIANAGASQLAVMQDLEFVGYAAMVQEARDARGTVGLGGNGQFTRLSALRSIGGPPWSDCLTEDLDLGLTLARHGWRIRFCPDVWVAQQGVLGLKPLLRQRTRWIQGHYQCWRHVPRIVSAKRIPVAARIDLVFYLYMVFHIWLVAAGPALMILSLFGLVSVDTSFLAGIDGEIMRNSLRLLLAVGPLCLFVSVYQSHSVRPFPGRWIPAIIVLFTLYTYLMLISQVWAIARLAMGRSGWVKTARVRSEAAV